MSKSMEINTAAIYLRKSTEDDGKSVAEYCETCHLLYNPRMRILIVLLLLLTASVSCGGEAGGEARRYDEEIRNNFLVECEVEGDASSCAKVLSCIEEDMTQDEFVYEESLGVLTGGLSDRLADVVARCLAEN